MIEAKNVAADLFDLLTTQTIEIEGNHLSISASIGMTYAYPGKQLKEIMKEADMAMYAAKGNGRSQLQVH